MTIDLSLQVNIQTKLKSYRLNLIKYSKTRLENLSIYSRSLFVKWILDKDVTYLATKSAVKGAEVNEEVKDMDKNSKKNIYFINIYAYVYLNKKSVEFKFCDV